MFLLESPKRWCPMCGRHLRLTVEYWGFAYSGRRKRYYPNGYCKQCFPYVTKSSRYPDRYPPLEYKSEVCKPEFRECRACRTYKDPSAFAKKLDGLQTCCRRCDLAARKRRAQPTPEKQREYQRRYKEKYPDRPRAISHKRYLRMHTAGVFEEIGFSVSAQLLLQRHLCFYCNKRLELREATTEHIQPLARGGKHTLDNLAVVCSFCNTSKCAKTLEEYLLWRLEHRGVPLQCALAVTGT